MERTNITPRKPGHNPHVPSRTPRREEIPGATVDVMLKGGPTKADLLVVDVGDGPMIVKDFANKKRWVRHFGRLSISREYRAYRWLAGMQGIPALIGRVDALAFAMEKIEGPRLWFADDRHERGADYVVELRALLDRIHARGLAHLDLRGRENILVRPGGDLAIVDFAGAAWFRPGGLGHRLLFPLLSRIDETAYLKWKERLTPGQLTPAEHALARKFDRLRPLWPFNRKRYKNRD
jgi:predicted Ser/Thr protein kinase